MAHAEQNSCTRRVVCLIPRRKIRYPPEIRVKEWHVLCLPLWARPDMKPSLFRAFVLLLLICGTASGCSSGSTTALAPSPVSGRCAVDLNLTPSAIAAAGGSGTLTVQTHRECSWAIETPPSWIRLTLPAVAQGPAEVAYTADANRSTSARSWDVVIGSRRNTIVQNAATCTWTVSREEIVLSATGGEARVMVATEDFCSWEVPTPARWVEIAPPQGQGTTEITLRVSRNQGGPRSERIEIHGASIEVAQREAPPPVPAPNRPTDPPIPPLPPVPPSSPTPSPPAELPPPTPPAQLPPAQLPVPPPARPTPVCTYAITPERIDVSSGSDKRDIKITTHSTCSYTVASAVSWIRVSSSTKTGTDKFQIEIAKNRSSAIRTGSVTIRGDVFARSVEVTQRAEQRGGNGRGRQDDKDKDDEEEKDDDDD